MRNIAAYLLCVLGGKPQPTAEDIKKVLDVVGIEADDAKLNDLISKMKGKTVNEVMEAGRAKLSSVSVGAAPAPAAAGGAMEEAKEEEKEEAKEESESESDEDMGLGLFD